MELICSFPRHDAIVQAIKQFCKYQLPVSALRWRHNGHGGVSNHQPHHCLLNRLFGCRSKKTSKLRVTGLCAGNSTETGEFPAQMASDAENVSIWWRHHGVCRPCRELFSWVLNKDMWYNWLCSGPIVSHNFSLSCVLLYPYVHMWVVKNGAPQPYVYMFLRLGICRSTVLFKAYEYDTWAYLPTAHKGDVTSAIRRLILPAIRLFVQNVNTPNNQASTLLSYCAGKPLVVGEFPAQRTSNG